MIDIGINGVYSYMRKITLKIKFKFRLKLKYKIRLKYMKGIKTYSGAPKGN